MDTFISVVLSSIIAIFITWYFTRKQMKKNEITHFSINSYDVGKGLHNEFPQFQLTYENKELNNEVQVLKGGFLNSGRNDIIGLKNNSDINIILPQNCSLKDIKIKPLSDDMDVKACVNEKVANIINFAINEKFMSGEGFEYTAIIETTEEIKNLHHQIDFKHRIPNTSKIKNENIISQQPQRGRRGLESFLLSKKEKAMGILSIIGSILFCLLSVSSFFVQKVEFYVVEKETNKAYLLYMTPQSQLYISDNNIVPFWDNQKLTKKELDKNYYISSKTNYSWNKENSAIAGLSLAILGIFYFVMAIIFFYLWNRKKRIYHLLDQYEKE